jgi:undecaprenyl-diphosphatase
VLVAFVTAFVVSMVAIRWLMEYVKNHDFTFFGKYRIVLGIILIIIAIITAAAGATA